MVQPEVWFLQTDFTKFMPKHSIYHSYTNKFDMIYLFTAIGLTPSDSSTVHIYTQTIHRTTQSTQTIQITMQLTNWEECGPCSVSASYALAFALQLREKHGKTSVRVAKECQQWLTSITILNLRIRENLLM
jgi:hypothetical protein